MKAISSFVRRLREDPDFREEVRRIILTDELLALPARVEALRAEIHEEFRRVWETIRALTQQVEALRAEMHEEFRRVWETIGALTQRLDSLAQRVVDLTESQRLLAKSVGRLANVVGMTVEEEAGDVAQSVLQGRGFRLLEGPFTMEVDGDVDVVLHVQRPPEQPLFVLIEAKLRLHAGDVQRWSDKLQDPAFLVRLRGRGITGRAVPYAYGMRVYKNAVEAGTALGIGVMGPDGEIVEPKTFLDIAPEGG